jgi:hypothetical protein
MNLLDQVAKQFVFMVNNDPPPLKFAERELQICGLAEAARPTSDLGRVFVLIRDANSAKVNSSPVAVTMIFTWSDQKEPSANAVQTGFNCPSNRPRISRSCGEPRSCAGRRRLLLDASRTECPKRQSGAPKADLPLPATFGRPLCAQPRPSELLPAHPKADICSALVRERRELRQAGSLVALEPQLLDLIDLVRNRDHVVTRDNLLDRGLERSLRVRINPRGLSGVER